MTELEFIYKDLIPEKNPAFGPLKDDFPGYIASWNEIPEGYFHQIKPLVNEIAIAAYPQISNKVIFGEKDPSKFFMKKLNGLPLFGSKSHSSIVE
jgi:hypothetical protein